MSVAFTAEEKYKGEKIAVQFNLAVEGHYSS